MRHVPRLAVLLVVPLFATPGCAPNDLDGPPTVDIEGSAGERPISVIVPVRKGGKASAEEFAAASAPVLGGAPLPIFLNRQGGTYRGGSDDSATNRSSVVEEQGLSSLPSRPTGAATAAGCRRATA